MTTTIPPRWRLLLALLRHLPQGALSRGAGLAADTPIPRRLRAPVLGLFARMVGADPSEAELPLGGYRSVNQFFIRRLAPGARPMPEDPHLAVSPVDGVVSQLGTITGGRLVQVKGRTYSAASLLDDSAAAARFDGGTFVCIYLSPRHYHRIHSPCSGSVAQARHIPGLLLPVNPPSAAASPELYARNERLVCYIDGPLGRVAVVAVGALNVGRISAAFDPDWNRSPRRDPAVTNRRRAVATTRCYSPGVEVERGDELMAFHLGSSIVLLFEPDRVRLRPLLDPGLELRVGAAIAEPPSSAAAQEEPEPMPTPAPTRDVDTAGPDPDGTPDPGSIGDRPVGDRPAGDFPVGDRNGRS